MQKLTPDQKKINRNITLKKYRQKNKEKIKDILKRYRERNKDKINSILYKYRAKNKDKIYLINNKSRKKRLAEFENKMYEENMKILRDDVASQNISDPTVENSA